jgi:hypothetical protein
MANEIRVMFLLMYQFDALEWPNIMMFVKVADIEGLRRVVRRG